MIVLVVAAGLGYYFLSAGSGTGTTSSTSSSASIQTVQVKIPSGTNSSVSLNYEPATITVVIGVNNTVSWVNQDVSIHTVIANDTSFNSGDMASGTSFSHTFTTAGTFDYYCKYHYWMRGIVVVKG